MFFVACAGDSWWSCKFQKNVTVQVLRVLFLELVQMVWYWYFFSLILAAMGP